jgi:hypothetical protein
MNIKSFNYIDTSILTNLSLFCTSGHLLTILQFISSSLCSAGLLYINLFCHSALLFISHCTYAQSPPAHPLIFLFLQFHSFLIQNNQHHDVCLIFFYTQSRRFNFPSPSAKERQLSKQLKHQLIGNHESVSLTDS